MAFDPDKDIKPEDMLVLESIKYDPDAIRKVIYELADKTDEYSRGLLGILTQMLGFLEQKSKH